MSVKELTWGMTVMTAVEVVVFDGTSMAPAYAYVIVTSLQLRLLCCHIVAVMVVASLQSQSLHCHVVVMATVIVVAVITLSSCRGHGCSQCVIVIAVTVTTSS